MTYTVGSSSLNSCSSIPLEMGADGVIAWPHHTLVNRSSYINIESVLRHHWLKTEKDCTIQQWVALDRIRSALTKDKAYPENADQSIAWDEFECVEWFGLIDDLFFSGGLKTHVKFIAVDSIEHPKGGEPLGVTYMERYLESERTFDVYTIEMRRLNDSNIYQTKAQKRTKAMYTICHEAIHAIFFVYGCRCSYCKQVSYPDMIGKDGHGPAFQSVARTMSGMLTDFLGEFSSFSDFDMYQADPLGLY